MSADRKADKKIDILIAGVGGQGTILAGKIISNAGLLWGLDVKLSETHGMAQRGGSVVTHVRMGEKVYSPLNSEGEVDFILAFEQLEALRWIHYLAPRGTVIVNTQKLDPLPVMIGACTYPDGILDTIKSRAYRTLDIDVMNDTPARNNPRVTNMVLIGVLASLLHYPVEDWDKVLIQNIPPKFVDLNREALTAGHKLGREKAAALEGGSGAAP